MCEADAQRNDKSTNDVCSRIRFKFTLVVLGILDRYLREL